MKTRRIGPDEVFEKFGVAPDRVVDVQALAGDSVDNVPGAPGIGLKTAAPLIQEYGDLDSAAGARGRDQAAQTPRDADRPSPTRSASRATLVTLDCDTPVEDPLEALEVREPNPQMLLDFLARDGVPHPDRAGRGEGRPRAARAAAAIGRRASSRRTARPTARGDAPATPALPPSTAPPTRSCATRGSSHAWIARIRDAGAVAVDTETTALDEMRRRARRHLALRRAGRGRLHPGRPRRGRRRPVRRQRRAPRAS